jgi:hypothetical protein
MKPDRNADALAEALMSAAVKPLPLPAQRPQEYPSSPSTDMVAAGETNQPGEEPLKAPKVSPERAQITLRLLRELLDDYTFQAAERTKIERRVVSAQEIMLEVLERGRPRVAQ